MGAVYRRVLATMERVGWAAPRKRVRIGRARLLLIMLRYGLIG
jgi:phytoene synthase